MPLLSSGRFRLSHPVELAEMSRRMLPGVLTHTVAHMRSAVTADEVTEAGKLRYSRRIDDGMRPIVRLKP